MRYRIGDNPEEPGTALDQGSFLAIAILSFFIGIGFFFAGIRSKHYWMAIWGSGLSISSLIYIIYVLTILQERILSAIRTIADKVRSCKGYIPVAICS